MDKNEQLKLLQVQEIQQKHKDKLIAEQKEAANTILLKILAQLSTGVVSTQKCRTIKSE